MAEKTKTEEKQEKNKILLVIGILAVAAAILIVISSAKSQSNPQTVDSADVTQAPIVESNELTAQKWTWVNTQMNDGSENLPSKEGAFTLTFQEDGTVLATTDCNNGNGSYELGPDNSITIGPIATTMMFCEGSAETQFYQDLNNVGSYKIDNGQLWLMIKFDSGTMIFK